MSEGLNLIEKAEEAGCDLIEVRLDCFQDYNKLQSLSSHTKVPTIATNRPSNRQGYFFGSESERHQSLLVAAKKGFDYVDLDLSTPKIIDLIAELKKLGVKLIVSSHQFERAFNSLELKSILQEEINAGADVCKIVSMARKVEDNLRMLNFVSQTSKKTRIVCFCMGELGRSSRLLSPIFGGYFTFASLKSDHEIALGQMSIKDMQIAYECLGAK